MKKSAQRIFGNSIRGARGNGNRKVEKWNAKAATARNKSTKWRGIDQMKVNGSFVCGGRFWINNERVAGKENLNAFKWRHESRKLDWSAD